MKEPGSGEVISFRREYDFRDVEEIQPMQQLIKSQKGQSLVEFALVLPVFVVILFGIMEFGRLWEVSNILTSAAREGARVAAVSEPDVEKAKTAARSVLAAGHISGATITVSGPNSTSDVSVTVALLYKPMTGSIIPGFGSFSLTRSTTMRWEG
jgi:Flp pilus assembly protein TadG